MFFAGDPPGRGPIRDVALAARHKDLGLFWFENVALSGTFVLAIIDEHGRDVTASGLHLGGSEHNDALVAPPVDGEMALPALISPVWSRVRRTNDLRPDEVHEPGEDVPIGAVLDPESGPEAAVAVALLGTTEQHELGSTLRLDWSLGTNTDAFRRTLPLSYVTDAPYLAHLRDAFVNMRRGLVLNDGKLWGPSSRQALHGDTNLVFFPEFVRRGDSLAFVGVGPVRPHRSRKIPVLLCNAGAGNFGHWLMNTLYSVLLLRESALAGEVEFVSPPLTAFQRESLDVLGLLNCVVEVSDHHLLFDRILFPSPLSTSTNARPPRQALELFAWIKERVRASVGAHSVRLPGDGRRLYLTRRGAVSGRNMVNELELIVRLRALGFACIAPHELTFSQEVSAFAEAEIIVSAMGASLVNQAFAPPGCDIVEITTSAYHSNEFLFLANLLGNRWTRAMVGVRPEDKRHVGNFDYNVPVEEIVGRIECITEEREGSMRR